MSEETEGEDPSDDQEPRIKGCERKRTMSKFKLNKLNSGQLRGLRKRDGARVKARGRRRER